MYIDKELEFSNEQAVTASAASTNHVDKGLGDAGLSERKHIAITVTEAATAAGAATVTFELQQDSDTDFGTAETVIASQAIGKADLVPGKQIFLPIPIGVDKQFIRMNYVVATGPLTAGKFTAQIVDKPQKSPIYANAID